MNNNILNKAPKTDKFKITKNKMNLNKISLKTNQKNTI